jgi:hypothetical protein
MDTNDDIVEEETEEGEYPSLFWLKVKMSKT